jgi:translation initiation factor IF-3
MPPPVQNQPRVNEEIASREVQVIDQTGASLGVVMTEAAIRMAADAGCDLVEIAPDAQPVVCKFATRRR